MPEPEREKPRRLDYRVTRFLVALEEIAVVTLLVALLVIAVVQVVSRYVLNVSVQWTEEVSQIAIVYLAFIGAALVSAKGDHVTMRVLGRLLGRRGRVILAALAHVVILGSSVAMVILGIEPTRSSLAIPLPATHWPAGLTYAGAVVGFALIAAHAVMNLVVVFRGGYDEAREDIEEGVI